MKTIYKVLIGLAIIATVVALIYLLRNSNLFGGLFGNLWVGLSGLYGASMILLGKFKGIFGGSKGGIQDLQNRLDEVNRIEKELIDTLMKDREIFKEKLAEVESKRIVVQEDIRRQEEELEDYQDYDTWEENIWNQMSEQEQIAEVERVIGPALDLSKLKEEVNDM